MSDIEGLGDFFVYVFFVYPVTGYLLKPGRFRKATGLGLAIAFLIAVASVKTGLEFQEKGPNYYSLLGVDRYSSEGDIKKAYKSRALELHPDKNPSPEAADMFDKVRTAFDVLSNVDDRESWERFGPERIQGRAVVEDSQVFFEMLIFHAAWALLAFVLTLGRSNGEARGAVYVGQLGLFLVETYLTLQKGAELPFWMPGFVAKYEVVQVLRSLFPAFVNGARCVGSVIHVDTEEANRRLFLRLDEQNKDVLMVLRSLQVTLSNLQAQKGGGGVAAQPVAVTATGKLRELEERLASGGAGGGAAAVADIGESLKAEKKGNPMMNVLGFLAIYFGLQYLFAGSGQAQA